MSTKNKSPSSINDDETLKPERKKLKSCEPDLKITVGGAVDGSDAIEYWYHASIMANHSNYIDTMLASGMKESNTYEVSFPDIAPATWESMMKFLDKPLAIRLMTVQDVMEVAPWYDKYDFPEGRALSSNILTEYIKGVEDMYVPDVPGNLDFFIGVILLADALHLDEAKNMGVLWIGATMENSCRNILSRDHIAKLAPLIAKEGSLIATVKLFVKSVVTKDDILHRLFPELLVERFSSYNKNVSIQEWAPSVKLSGSRCNADGEYFTRLLGWEESFAPEFLRRRTGRWRGQDLTFKITVRDDTWVILGFSLSHDSFVENIIWKCPHSRNLMLPPKVGWVPVDKNLAIGMNPTLKFIMQTEE
jgi:hypothetical protein